MEGVWKEESERKYVEGVGYIEMGVDGGSRRGVCER